MLYYNFDNYEEFKRIFGIQHHGNGVKSRKNKILLSYIKNRQMLHEAVSSGDYPLIQISDMAQLKQIVTAQIKESGIKDNLLYKVNIKDEFYSSSSLYTDKYNGLCEDGDYKSFRYVNAENDRVFKMKIGKLFRKIILETTFGKKLPEQIITYLCEEITQEWQAHAMSTLPVTKLYVNKDFSRIYNSRYLDGDFHSCMTDEYYYSFYEDAVDASAAYLENEEGLIIARCIIYNKVKDQNGNEWRLAERQYSTDENNVLKQVLIDSLIKEKYIDGYKKIGAGAGDSCAFLDLDENSLSEYEFSIECDLDYGDNLSYQDSFKNYNINSRIADNYGYGDIELDTDSGSIVEKGEYDDYHGEHCDEVTTVYKNGIEYSCNIEMLEDFIRVNDEYHHENDVEYCDHCSDPYLSENNYHSELTDEYYCCASCYESAEDEYKYNHWKYSEYDDEYYEDEDEVTTYKKWYSYSGTYKSCTINQETLDYNVEEGIFFCYNDIVYDTIDEETELPYGVKTTTNKAA